MTSPERAAASARQPAIPVLTIEVDDGGAEGVLQSTEHAGQLIQQYVQELRTEIAIGIDPAPPVDRRLIWGLGLGVVAASLLLCLLLWNQSQVMTASGQAAALHARELCAARQAAVMDAITDYTRDHGEAPADLASLTLEYLDFVPSDPSTGEPFKYGHEGAVAWLVCPRHPLPPFLKAPSEPLADAPDERVEAAPAAVAPEGSAETGTEAENETDHPIAANVDGARPERQNPPE